MAFTALDVKKLREMTNVGMMDCKKALSATDGDMDKAVEWLREKGLAKAAKKAEPHRGRGHGLRCRRERHRRCRRSQRRDRLCLQGARVCRTLLRILPRSSSHNEPGRSGSP